MKKLALVVAVLCTCGLATASDQDWPGLRGPRHDGGASGTLERSEGATFGVACATGADCCSNNCADTAGLPCAGGAGCACAPSAGCHASGDPCAGDQECCNGLCSMGFCAEVGSCRTAGEPCGTEGLSGSCCSAVCLAAGDDTVARCQFLGGCRVQDDLCASDGECCSGSCAADGMTTDGRPIMRCANVDSCLPVGERCNIGVSVNCCPNGGGDMGCEPTAGGFSRCFGGGSMCVLAGMPCTVGGDPCCPEPPGLMCTPGTPRGTICCLPDGAECAFGDLCCGGVCAPDASGVLRCGSSCVPDGGACTVDADCCGCCRDTVCVSGTACGACTGPMLGELCDPAGPACCDAPAVICNTAVEFPTCILAM